MKRLADSHEPTGLIPPVAGIVPVQVEVALGAVPVEVGHVAVPIRVHPDGTQLLYRISSKSPPIEFSPG